MRLIFTDNTFLLTNVAMPGVPFLLDKNGCLVEIANRYLYFVTCISGRTRAKTTHRTYADHIYDFFSFLEENDLTWDSITSALLASWRNGMQARGLKRGTCNNRIRTISAFYTWCKRSNLIEKLPFDQTEIQVSRSNNFLSHINSSGNRTRANDLLLPSIRPVPKFLSLQEAALFIEALSPKRTRLVAWLMLLTGLRREEAALLDVRVLPNLGGQDPTKSIKIVLNPDLTPTKGAKERWIHMPYALAGHLHDYLMQERPKLAQKYKRRYGKSSTKLFLTGVGEELSLDGLDEKFRRTSKLIGIKCHPHMLRHTFAVHELVRMSGRPKINALKWVSDRLGHASITTTDIYLKAADIVIHDDVDGYVSEIINMMGKGCRNVRPSTNQ